MAELEIYGIGVDLIEVKKIKSAIEKNPGFIKKGPILHAQKMKQNFPQYSERHFTFIS